MGERIPPKLICVTPVKNEAWILDRFLACASLWADHIIVADQCSEDDSREIALRYPKVTLIENSSPAYDEAARQRLLLDAARRISGRRIILALDADEMLTANWMDSPEWQTLQQAPAGTILRFQWIHVCPDLTSCWVPPEEYAFGFVDDGSDHHGSKIHSTRIPTPCSAPTLFLRDVKFLHYQFTDWERMKSKQRWYQCWDTVNNDRLRPIIAYRLYHHMDAIPPEQIQALPREWIAGYEQQGIDMTSVRRDGCYRWERATIALLQRYGAGRFRKVDIWDVEWEEIARRLGYDTSTVSLNDPRTLVEKLVHYWMRRTQKDRYGLRVRLIQRLLRSFGW
jgi:glycosyltransferase involved in cell wall biosynthesis